MPVPKGLKIFAGIFALCLCIALSLVAWWYAVLVRTPGVYSMTEMHSCNVIFLHSDGTYAQRVDLYNSGHDDDKITSVIHSTGTWHSIDGSHVELSGTEFVDETGARKYTAPLAAETLLRSGIFHTLTVHAQPRDLTYDRPLTGSTACWMVGMS